MKRDLHSNGQVSTSWATLQNICAVVRADAGLPGAKDVLANKLNVLRKIARLASVLLRQIRTATDQGLVAAATYSTFCEPADKGHVRVAQPSIQLDKDMSRCGWSKSKTSTSETASCTEVILACGVAL